MRIVIALGGNALLQRGEPSSAETQRRNVRTAARAIASVAKGNELVLTHGNGPQIGLLALQATGAEGMVQPLDVLGAETEGMIGYLLEQELVNALGENRVATLLTRVEVDPRDPAFAHPTKFIGPQYEAAAARALARTRHWTLAQDGPKWRRVVASPEPRDILEIRAIRLLAASGFVTICAGGGGIPVTRVDDHYEGVECVVDKDLTSALLAERLAADCLLMLTDVEAVFSGFGTPAAQPIRRSRPDELERQDFPAGSMGPKVMAACRFARTGLGPACIGRLDQVADILAGRSGTRVVAESAPGLD